MNLLIIKLGAKGDVIRTLPVALALKKKFPDSQITWITKKSNSEFVKNSPYVDKVLFLPYSGEGGFDLLYNFDIEEEAGSLASEINAGKKLGFYKNQGYACAFNLGAEYYLNTLFDDEVKKTNKKTYQEMMFSAAELEFKREFHPIILSEKEKKYSEDFFEKNRIAGKKLIGVNIGSSPRWPSKFWNEERIVDFVLKSKEQGYEVLLFSGPDDSLKIKKIRTDLISRGVVFYENNPENSDLEFASLIDLCDFVVCGDTFAMHVSIALMKNTIALFFCTSPNEVEGYGVVKKIVSPLLYEFFPEKSDEFSEGLVNSISSEQVLKAIKSCKNDE